MTTRQPPRYRQLADSLRDRILKGFFKPGDLLPTEMDLCSEYGVSRHTARDALRILIDDKLIVRRQGAGSTVAEISPTLFTQETGQFADILQYARNATFHLEKAHDARSAILKKFALKGKFRCFSGTRQVAEQPPIAVSRILIAKSIAPPDNIIDELNESVSEWLERNHGVWIEQVEQRIEAVLMEADHAQPLGVKVGSAALQTSRRYLDADGVTVMYSDSVHVANRFAYAMEMKRKR